MADPKASDSKTNTVTGDILVRVKKRESALRDVSSSDGVICVRESRTEAASAWASNRRMY
jgi:hypothetical protein